MHIFVGKHNLTTLPREKGFPLLIPCTVPESRRMQCRRGRPAAFPFDCDVAHLTGLGAFGDMGPFSFFLWLAAAARHPGMVASRRGAGGKGLAPPLPPYDPQPRVGAAIRDRLSICSGSPPASSLPRGRGHRPPAVPLNAGRASGRRRSFRPCGAAISSAPCRAYASKTARSAWDIWGESLCLEAG